MSGKIHSTKNLHARIVLWHLGPEKEGIGYRVGRIWILQPMPPFGGQLFDAALGNLRTPYINLTRDSETIWSRGFEKVFFFLFFLLVPCLFCLSSVCSLLLSPFLDLSWDNKVSYSRFPHSAYYIYIYIYISVCSAGMFLIYFQISPHLNWFFNDLLIIQ